MDRYLVPIFAQTYIIHSLQNTSPIKKHDPIKKRLGRPPSFPSSTLPTLSISEIPSPNPKKQRIDWFKTPLIRDILAAYNIQRSGYKTVQFLQRTLPNATKDLAPSTIDTWFDREHQLKPQYQQMLEFSYKKKGGTDGMFDNNQSAEQIIISIIRQSRSAGIAIKINDIKIIMSAVIQKECPELMNEYKLSLSFISHWAREKMGLSSRRVTTAAGKLPHDWNIQGNEMIQRLASLIETYKVPPSLLINFDQTAIHLIPKSRTTYELKGSKSVAVVGADDKRQITAVVGCSYTGNLLPIQLVYEGKTTECHAPHNNNTTLYKFQLTHSPNHWSDQNTMREYFKTIIQPYIDEEIRKNGLTKEFARAIVLLDCWSVHKSDEFRSYVKREHPNILLVYIPPCCTNKFQVADVALNFPFKAGIRQRYEKWATETMLEQLINNNPAPTIQTGMYTVKPLCLEWAFQSWYNLSKHPELIVKGWHRSITEYLDPFDATVQFQAKLQLLKGDLVAYDFVPNKEEPKYNPDDFDGNEEDSDSGTEEFELDLLKTRVYGQRKSSRKRKLTTEIGSAYTLNTQQLDLDNLY